MGGDIEAPSFRSLVADITDRIGTHAAQVQATESESHPVPVAVPAPVDERPSQPPRRSWSLGPRARPTVVVAAVFGINLVETKIESIVRDRFGWGVDLGNQMAAAFRGLEGNLSFESHDVTNWFAVYGYSLAYFFVLPAIGLLPSASFCGAGKTFMPYGPVPVDRGGLSDQPRLLPVLSGARALVLCRLGGDSALGSLVVAADRIGPADQRDGQLFSEHTRLADRRPHSGQLHGRPAIATYDLRARHKRRHIDVRLGIHWLPDIAAGVAVGVLSVSLARSCRVSPEQGSFGRGSRWRRRRSLASAAGSGRSPGALVTQHGSALAIATA